MKPKKAIDEGLVELRSVWCRKEDIPIIKLWIPSPSLCETHRRILAENAVTEDTDGEQQT